MAEKKKSFFKLVKQFATGEEDASSSAPIKEKDLPTSDAELEELMKQINPEFLEKAKAQGGAGNAGMGNLTPSTSAPVRPLDEGPVEDSKLVIAEIGHLIENIEKMDKPGPQHAYFEFLSARDEMGNIPVEAEAQIYKAIFQGLKASPDLRKLSGEALVKDAERQLHYASKYATERKQKIQQLHEEAKTKRQAEIKDLQESNQATQAAINQLVSEMEARNKKIIDLETQEATSARDFVLENQAADKAAQKVLHQINNDIPKLRKYFTDYEL